MSCDKFADTNFSLGRGVIGTLAGVCGNRERFATDGSAAGLKNLASTSENHSAYGRHYHLVAL
jgi:hypothetical protein